MSKVTIPGDGEKVTMGSDGHLVVPDRPGWGTEPIEAAIRARPPKTRGGLVQPRGLGGRNA